MIKLIKNEIFKILHKKGTYIVLIITALFITLVSYLIGHEETYFSTETYFDVDTGDVTQNKINKEMNEKYQKYNKDTWQHYVIDDTYDIVSNYYYALDSGEISDEVKKSYQDVNNALANDDWQYFVNKTLASRKEELKTLEESLKYATADKEKKNLESQIFTIKVAIEMLEYRLKENVKYGNDYLNEAIDAITYSASAINTYENTTNKETKSELEDTVKIYYKSRYILENKEDINNASDLKFILSNFYSEYLFLILVFGIMIGGAIVSEEYNKGTIKSLLITPYKRSTILLSKFISVILLTILFIVIAYFMQTVIGGIFLGFGSLSNHVVEYNLATKSLEVMSVFKYILLYTIANLPQILLLVTLAFAVSTIIGNTALAIVITFAGVIGSSIINMFASMYKIKVLNYFVTTNWNFNYYLFGGTNPYGPSITQAIIVCLVYFLIMIITSFIVFNKKNIKNI
mgnify:FL=1